MCLQSSKKEGLLSRQPPRSNLGYAYTRTEVTETAAIMGRKSRRGRRKSEDERLRSRTESRAGSEGVFIFFRGEKAKTKPERTKKTATMNMPQCTSRM